MLAKVIRYDCLERTTLFPGGNDHNVVGVLVVAFVLHGGRGCLLKGPHQIPRGTCSPSTANKVITYFLKGCFFLYIL